MKNEKLITRATAHAVLRYAIILSGWVFLGLNLLYEYQEYGIDLIIHLFSSDSIGAFVFHRAMILAPVMSTFVGYVMKKLDIAEQTAQKAEGELRSVYNAISGHLTVISPDYRILGYNETVEKQFGGNLKGRLCYEAYQARDCVCPDCAVKKTLETKKPAYTYQPATSLSKSVEIYTYPIFDEKGEVSAVVEHGTEIVERTELEENYHRQRVLMNTVFETTPDVMYIKDGEGRYLMVNKAFEDFVGMSRDNAIDKTMEDILPGEFAAESRASDLRVLEGETYHKEQRAAKDGKEFIFDTIKMPLRDNYGVVYGIVGISRDITDLKRAVEALRESEELYRTFTTNFQGIAYRGNMNFIPLFFHGAVEKITGYKEQDFLSGKPRWDEVIHPDDRDRLSASFQMINTMPEFYDEREYRIVRKDGKIRWVREYIQNVCDDSGKPVYVQGSIYDVHERRQAEEALRESEERHRMLFNSGNDGIFVHGFTEEGMPGKFIEVNDIACRMYGYSKEELLELSPSDMRPPEKVTDIPPVIEKLLAQGHLTFESTARTKNGASFPVEISSQIFHFKGRTAALSIVRDITDRKRAEEELRRSEERYRALIDNLAVGIAVINPKMEIVSFNSKIQEWFPDIDVSKRPICYKSFNQPPRDDVCSYCPTAMTLEDGEVHASITDTPAGDEIRHYNIVSSPLRNENGEIIAAVEMVEDITERRRAEESRQRLLKAVESLTVGVTISDAGGKIIYTNPAEASMHGYEVEELMGMDVNSLAPQEIWKDIELEERGSAFTRESTNVRKDGSAFPVQLTSVRVGDDESAPFSIITVCEDITERKLAEEALRGSEERYRALIDNIAVGIAVISPRMEILSVNSKMQEWFPDIDASKRPICYKSFNQPPREDVCSYCPITKTLEDGEVHVSITDTPAGDEIRHYNIVSSSLRNENGEIIAAIEMCEDITERKRAEEALRAAKGIAEEERAKNEAIIACIGDGISIHDRDYKILYQNEAHVGMIGNHVGEYCYKAYEGKDHVCEGCSLAKAFGDGGIHYSERAVTAGDDSLHVAITASPLRDAEGNIIAGIEVVKNITERKKAEEELAYNQLFLKSIIENEPECVKLVDAEGTLIDMNASGLKMIDADSLEQVKGQDVYGLIAPEHREAFKAHVERVCQGEKSMLEFRAVGLKGRSIWLETHAVPFYDAREKRTLLLAVTRDVTERKEAEDEIKEINARLQTLVDSIPGVVFFKDAKGRHLVANKACAEMIGLKEEEIIGKTADDFFPADIAEYCNRSDEEVIRAGRTVRGEEKAGEKVLETIKSPLFDESGNYKGLVGLGFDVTERKQAEEALRKSEEKYHSLFDSARDAILIADAQSGIIVNANRQAEKLLGRPASEIIGMHQSELHPEEDKELYRSAFRKAVKNEKAAFPEPGGDMYVVNEKGRKIPVEISANVIKLEGNRLIQGIFHDITERRAAERAAREGRQYLENVLNSIQDGLAIIAKDHTIVLANPTIEKWYAHRGQVVGGKCYEVFRGGTEVCDPCPCAEARDRGESCFDVVSHYGPEGRGGTLELYGFPLCDPSTGEVTGMVHYYRDITDRVALQAEAFRAAQLASVGELAAGVAHEINNPINGIINYAQMLINRLPKGSEENSISQRIIKEGDRISDIVSALLTFTREDGPMEEPVHIEELVSEALSLTISQMAKDGIDVRTNISADMPRVNVKRQHLEQVFLNLLNNARHALNAKYPERHPGKILEISGESMDAAEIPHIRISFKDLGTGIAADIIDRVTEPFFTTKQKGSGTGLGLSISSSIIKNSGGTLSIESVEGEFTRVTIELPINGAQ